MNTKTIDKAEITAQLRTMVEERLFGDKAWPIDDNAAVHKQLIGWGLVEVIDEAGSRTTTALGRELAVGWWSAFVGHHEPAEIPDTLVQMGALTEAEADHIILDRWERDGENLETILPPILRRAYRENEFLNAVRGLVGAVRGYLNSTGDDYDHIAKMEGSVADVLNKAREAGQGLTTPSTEARVEVPL
jgi:hypothetical protein